jgi:hypothetical protein
MRPSWAVGAGVVEVAGVRVGSAVGRSAGWPVHATTVSSVAASTDARSRWALLVIAHSLPHIGSSARGGSAIFAN